MLKSQMENHSLYKINSSCKKLHQSVEKLFIGKCRRDGKTVYLGHLLHMVGIMNEFWKEFVKRNDLKDDLGKYKLITEITILCHDVLEDLNWLDDKGNWDQKKLSDLMKRNVPCLKNNDIELVVKMVVVLSRKKGQNMQRYIVDLEKMSKELRKDWKCILKFIKFCDIISNLRTDEENKNVDITRARRYKEKVNKYYEALILNLSY